MTFRYRKKRTPQMWPFNRLEPDRRGEKTTGFIQGQQAGSRAEEYFAHGLEQITAEGRIDGYIYSYEFHGGAGMTGGLVADFLVFSRPTSTIAEVDGHFHNSEEDAARDARLSDAAMKAGMNREIIHVDAELLNSNEDGLRLARESF